MNVDIYIREKNGSREIRIPILPETITRQAGETAFISYDILNHGEVAVPSGTGLANFRWESEFPGTGRKNDPMLRGTWKEPKTYDSILLDWMKNGTELNLMVTGYPINQDVYLKEYSSKAGGAFGDLSYELVFLEMRKITIKTTKVETTTKRTETQSQSTTYTIKSGDTLWGIAQKFYGSGSKWKIIYDANKEIIESTARARWKAAGINRGSENGHWIFPGVKLTIPNANGTVTGGSSSSSGSSSAKKKTTTSNKTSSGGSTANKPGQSSSIR